MTDSSLENQNLVSVIIPNFNGVRQLEECLISLQKQTYHRIELVLVDNGSSDSSIKLAKEMFPSAKIICNAKNRGFAVATNQGVRASSGRYVFLLNNDTQLDADCIQTLVDSMVYLKKRQPEVIGIAPKILLSGPPVIDAIGNAIDPNGSAFNIGIGQADFGQYDEPMRLFGLCFAAAFIERSAFEYVGFLDESYFAYYEDVDWCYRARVFGYEFHSAPKAIVYHHHSRTAKLIMGRTQKYYLIHRNLLRTILKNYFRGNLIRAALAMLNHALESYRNLRASRFRKAWLHTKVLLDTLVWAPILLIKNLSINHRRTLRDGEIWAITPSRLRMIPVEAFDPETYSPILSLDVMEFVFSRMTLDVGKQEYLEGYLGVHAINRLVKSNRLKLSNRLVGELIKTQEMDGGLRLKEFLAYNLLNRTLMMAGGRSYKIGQFMLNLILIMRGRTLNETGRILVENYLSEESQAHDEYSETGHSELAHVIMTGLRWVLTYLAKLGFIEQPRADNVSV